MTGKSSGQPLWLQLLLVFIIACLIGVGTMLIARFMGVDDPKTADSTQAPAQTVVASPSVNVDMQGEWSDQDATLFVYRELSKNMEDWAEEIVTACANEPKGTCISNKILGIYPLNYSSHQEKLIVTSTNSELGCHGCGGAVSAFYFIKQPTGWTLARKYLGFEYLGSWGAAADNAVSLVKFGDDKFAIAYHGGFYGQGVSEEYYLLYGEQSNGLHQILRVMFGVDNSDNEPEILTKWSSEITIIPSSAKFSDISVKTTGIHEGKPLNIERTFKFDGTKYVTDSTWEPY